MVERILEKVVNEMVPHLEEGQLEHLKNVLYINFHGKEVCDQCTELVPRGESGDEAKIRMFLASKKAVNRQDNALKQYSREILNMLDFLEKRIEDITGMDLRYYYGVMREQRHIKVSTMQTRLHYLSSFWDFLITEELEALRVHCSNIRDRALVEFLYSTGVRVSELVALNVGDIEMGRQELTDQPLFVTLDKPHDRLTVAGVQYMLRKLRNRAGVKNTHPHWFRRTIATDLLARGIASMI